VGLVRVAFSLCTGIVVWFVVAIIKLIILGRVNVWTQSGSMLNAKQKLILIITLSLTDMNRNY